MRTRSWLVVLVALAACGADDAQDAAASSAGGAAGAAEPNGQTVTVIAVDNSFDPEEVVVEAGTEVVWENRGRNEHNIIPEDESAEWKVEVDAFQPDQSASYVFTEPGTYRYYCSIHGTIDVGMPGVVIVE